MCKPSPWILSFFDRFLLPFNELKVGIINPLVISLSQLHPMSWSDIIVFQYYCKYKKGDPSMILFFHLFTQHIFANSDQVKVWYLLGRV